MELRRYSDAKPFEFGDFELRELTPDAFDIASFAEIILPIGVERPQRESVKEHRMYLCLEGDIQFTVDDDSFRISQGDVLHIAKGEVYGFHNGGYEQARLLLFRVPGPILPGNVQP